MMAELDWLRKTTMWHHNRLAARVAKHLDLSVRYLDDVDAVNTTSALLPTTSCVYRDMLLRAGRVFLSSDAVLLETCKSGSGGHQIPLPARGEEFGPEGGERQAKLKLTQGN
jgi:hypothetical protein